MYVNENIGFIDGSEMLEGPVAYSHQQFDDVEGETEIYTQIHAAFKIELNSSGQLDFTGYALKVRYVS